LRFQKYPGGVLLETKRSSYSKNTPGDYALKTSHIMNPTKEIIMTLEELCNLRDKILMDKNYSTKEQIVLIELLNEQIYKS